MDDMQPNGYRYERKFRVDHGDEHGVRAVVWSHPSMFVQAYPPRFVNNIYLDSEGMQNYLASMSSVGNNRKVRLRWYGDLFGTIDEPVLEFKIKRGSVGVKEQHPFPSFRLGPGFCNSHFKRALREADIPHAVKVRLVDLNAVLLNRYYRWYFATLDGGYRITVDAKMEYRSVNRLRSNSVHQHVDHSSIIVELKHQVGWEGLADGIAGFFPYRVTKISKYVQGIERVFP